MTSPSRWNRSDLRLAVTRGDDRRDTPWTPPPNGRPPRLRPNGTGNDAPEPRPSGLDLTAQSPTRRPRSSPGWTSSARRERDEREHDPRRDPCRVAWRVGAGGGGRGGASRSATWTRRAGRSGTRLASRGSRRSSSRRPGRTSGSRRTRPGEASRRPGSMRRGGGSTCTTPSSARRRSRRSTTGSSGSESSCPASGRVPPSDLELGPYERDWVCALAVDARQPRLVPRRLGAVRAHRADVRDHDAHEAARLRARDADPLPVPRQAAAHRADDARRRRARRCAIRALLDLNGGARLFRFEREGRRTREPHRGRCSTTTSASTSTAGFTAKDFRTWGGTARRPPSRSPSTARPRRQAEERRVLAAVMRRVGERAGQHGGRRARVVRQPGRDRAVAGRQDARAVPRRAACASSPAATRSSWPRKRPC